MSRPFRRCGRSKRRFIAESTDGEPPKRELADLLRSSSEQGGWLPHLALEAGMDSALWLGSEARGTNYDLKADDRFIWAPFGVRGIPPVWNGRIEISAGAGGTYEKYWVSNPQPSVGFASRDGWGGYASAGALLALDRRRRFWPAATPCFFPANSNRVAHDDGSF